MDKLEKFLKEHASKKPLIIDETMLINHKLEKDFVKLEKKLEELAKKGKIRYKHETFPTETTERQIVVEWVG